MSTNDIHVCKFHKDDSSACLSCGVNSSVNEAYPVEVAENLSRSDISPGSTYYKCNCSNFSGF